MGASLDKHCWGVPEARSHQYPQIAGHRSSPKGVASYRSSSERSSFCASDGNPQEGRPKAARRQLRPKDASLSEGIIETWGHRDTPLEIDKVYEMRQQIGEGTTSRVFLAIRRSDRQPFACKVVDKRLLTRDKVQIAHLLKQLRKEVDILQRLDHPNVIYLQDMVETRDRIYCFMEYVEGGELYDHLYEHGPMAPEAAANMLFGLMSAVAHMHDRDVVHRDIKAENLMLVASSLQPSSANAAPSNASSSSAGSSSRSAKAEAAGGFFHEELLARDRDLVSSPRIKLIDFGFSTTLKLAPSHSFLGTPGYIAPEIRQDRSYYKGVDVWAVGILTYLVLACRLPFDREISTLPRSSGEVMSRFELTFPELLWADMEQPQGESVKELLRGMLHVEPAQRWNARRCLRHPWLSGEVFGRSFAKEQQQELLQEQRRRQWHQQQAQLQLRMRRQRQQQMQKTQQQQMQQRQQQQQQQQQTPQTSSMQQMLEFEEEEAAAGGGEKGVVAGNATGTLAWREPNGHGHNSDDRRDGRSRSSSPPGSDESTNSEENFNPHAPLPTSGSQQQRGANPRRIIHGMGMGLLDPPTLNGLGMCVSVPHLEGLAWAEDSDEEEQAQADAMALSGGGGGGESGALNGRVSQRQDMRRRVKGKLSPLRMGDRAVSTSDLRGLSSSRAPPVAHLDDLPPAFDSPLAF